MMNKQSRNGAAAVVAAAGIGIIGMITLLTGGCSPRSGDDVRGANAPPVKINEPVPANVPAAAAGAIAASQAQAAATASKAAADGDAYKRAREQSGQ